MKNNVKLEEIKGKIGILKGNFHYADILVIFAKERRENNWICLDSLPLPLSLLVINHAKVEIMLRNLNLKKKNKKEKLKKRKEVMVKGIL